MLYPTELRARCVNDLYSYCNDEDSSRVITVSTVSYLSIVEAA